MENPESSSKILMSILKKIAQGVQSGKNMLDIFVLTLSFSELNSFLLEVFSRKVTQITPAQLLHTFSTNRFVSPVSFDPIKFMRIEMQLYELARTFNYTPLELSPVTPLGTCASMGPVHQNKVISATRSMEVVSDSTNTVALHICHLKKEKSAQGRGETADCIKIANIHRQLRGQYFQGPGLKSHFKTFSLITAGNDSGYFTFEKECLLEHLTVYTHILRQVFKLSDIHVQLITTPGYTNPPLLLNTVEQYLRTEINRNQLNITLKPTIISENSYYRGLQFKIQVNLHDRMKEIIDGGFVDWSQSILSSKKERMLVSGLGLDRICSELELV